MMIVSQQVEVVVCVCVCVCEHECVHTLQLITIEPC